MQFEWDKSKALSNFKKHFEIAKIRDEKHSTAKEKREWIIGESDNGVLVIVFTKRVQGTIYRLISARKASKKERRLYEEYKGIPL